MTGAQMLIEQGKAEGLAKGRAEGKAKGKAEGKAELQSVFTAETIGEVFEGR
ncbi:MAG: hypothetical protein HYZ29_01180 [Myxococcales bacterium]|nr:hypothetical protein [Myxococcales bacterium]